MGANWRQNGRRVRHELQRAGGRASAREIAARIGTITPHEVAHALRVDGLARREQARGRSNVALWTIDGGQEA